MSDEVQRTLGRIESKLEEVHADVRDMRVDVTANTRWRWGITAVGSFVVTIGGYLGLR